MKPLKTIAITIITFLMLFTSSSCDRSSPPEITNGEFSFVLEYEYEGETYIIKDVMICSYEGLNPDSGIPTRYYSCDLKNNSELRILTFDADTESYLVQGRINKSSYVTLYCGDGGYYLGDPLQKDNGPCIQYVEWYATSELGTKIEKTALSNEELEKLFRIKIIRFEFCEPIENTFG